MVNNSFEITVPVLNEEQILDRNIKILHQHLSDNFLSYSWNIIVADNGSTDRTENIGMSLTNYSDLIKYVRIEERGVGGALKKSWAQSDAYIIGFLDLDLAVDLKYIEKAITAIHLSDHDMVYGTRLHQDADVIGRSLKREITSRLFNSILKKYLGTKISDGMCGFKFIKKELFNNLVQYGANSTGWFFSTEILIVGEWLGYNVMELPIEWSDTEDSHVKIIPLAIEYLKAMKKLKNRLQNNYNNG